MFTLSLCGRDVSTHFTSGSGRAEEQRRGAQQYLRYKEDGDDGRHLAVSHQRERVDRTDDGAAAGLWTASSSKRHAYSCLLRVVESWWSHGGVACSLLSLVSCVCLRSHEEKMFLSQWRCNNTPCLQAGERVYRNTEVLHRLLLLHLHLHPNPSIHPEQLADCSVNLCISLHFDRIDCHLGNNKLNSTQILTEGEEEK